ncbi:hypothetical protein QBC45DRAFT_454280 [Copromyces sp. CBS 386.78]|nr:hypothetical protein QBC45DRAFT_454280 [Copromyces sp. CBS 386.78]
MYEIMDTWDIPVDLLDGIRKPGLFSQFSVFESCEKLNVAFRWSASPGCYLLFLGSTVPPQSNNGHRHQFRGILSHRGILTPTWNADVMRVEEDVLGPGGGILPTKLVVMLLNQCENHLEKSIQQMADNIEKTQGLLPFPGQAGFLGEAQKLFGQYRGLTTSLLALKYSCRDLLNICSGFMAASKQDISSNYGPGSMPGNDFLRHWELLQNGIERTHTRLKFHLNRIDYLEDIHIRSAKSMAALKELLS